MKPKQLKGDLDAIETTIDRAEVELSVKKLMKEMIEWCRGLVDQTGEVDQRLEAVEGDVDGLLEGVSEGISPETAKVIVLGLESSRLLADTVEELLKHGAATGLDQLQIKRLRQLCAQTRKAIDTAAQVVAEIVIEEDGEPTGEPTALEEPDEEAELEDDAEDDEVVEEEASHGE